MLRIAVVSTVYKRTPPTGYGGIERVVSTLVEELVARGHHVTLFATPGSHCSGEVVEVSGYDTESAPSGRVSAETVLSEEPLYEAMAERMRTDRFDVIHDFSFDNLFVSRHPDHTPFVVSICIPVDARQPKRNRVGCSRAHAQSIGPGTRFVRYGIDVARWPVCYDKQRHFVQIAKIAPYKGQHEGLLAAALARREIHIVGNVEHWLYHRMVVSPLVHAVPRASYLGETAQTRDVLLPAAALIQTPKWFDAYPLIVLEAMACGTPVISYGAGGVPEQIEHGVTGFLCHGVRDLARMMRRVEELDPRACRAHAEKSFSVTRMADEYCGLYGEVMAGAGW